ncbi:alpha-L-fucosidase [Aestuariibaculum suncheonense]|uniref:alpha-L-fucosidase n=1 Tax=Aestuariibaculum suncheonense TaxID=1028745 RepID=A0A8J6QEQ5_9FLAO|nr:alpha-L-fucosidase [Aestuariibaculum suncheonense]MBD0835565.1 alpha-L-fucosidase [Aestuariibaculum suncheonense]
MKKRYIALALLMSLISFQTRAQESVQSKEERMAWFKDAKLGIFIHWGIYAVNGIDESWSFHNGYISYEDYMKQLNGFTAKKYDPEYWAKLIKKSGAKYTVITTKHHDGVALWNTKQGDLNVVDKTPAKRDLITPFAKAVREEGLKLGLYYSLLDWSYPDYPNFLRNQKRYEEDEKRWDKFNKFNFGQLKELTAYNPDLYWFDGDWEQKAEKWKAKEIRELLFKETPTTIINSRLQGYGDYATPEQGVPVNKPKDKYWELCMTMNNSWGYQPNDTKYKSLNQVIRIFVDCISMGGNLLLDIGPKADGTIPEEQVDILKGLGKWTNKHAAAIYGTRAGIPFGHFNGYTALSKDKTILYLYVDNKPNGPLLIKGLKNKVNRAWVVGNGTKLKTDVVGKLYWSKVPGLLYIDLPEHVQDENVTVIALQLDGEVDLYSEAGQVIESN